MDTLVSHTPIKQVASLQLSKDKVQAALTTVPTVATNLQDLIKQFIQLPTGVQISQITAIQITFNVDGKGGAQIGVQYQTNG